MDLLPFWGQKRKCLDATVRVYDDYNLIALQDLDTYDPEACECSSKFRAETVGHIFYVIFHGNSANLKDYVSARFL